jgi:hypothetical protein
MFFFYSHDDILLVFVLFPNISPLIHKVAGKVAGQLDVLSLVFFGKKNLIATLEDKNLYLIFCK